MKLYVLTIIVFSSISVSCQDSEGKEIFNTENPPKEVTHSNFDTTSYVYKWLDYNYKESLVNNIQPPEGYSRISIAKTPYASWLAHLPLRLSNNIVYLYNGEKKYNQSAQYAVVNIDVGNKDLQQCADAVMRLRAEYLYATKQYQKIHFKYTNGFEVNFSKWSSGNYPTIKNNKVIWTVSSSNDKSYKSFKRYITNIFTYAGTFSLDKELKPVKLEDIRAGDVFIKGGFPGHAVIVLEVVTNEATNDKCFMLAQSYMPAQNIHILKNPNTSDLTPWYSLKECLEVINTPEWTFYPNQLKRFE